MQSIVAPPQAGEFVMPHAVVMETNAGWAARVTRSKIRPDEFGKTSVFSYKDRPYVVGEEAMRNGNISRKTGPAKYVEGYLDVLMNASLLKVLPNGHPNIMIACAHSTNAVPYIAQMGKVLGGRHIVTKPDGTTVKYDVRAFITWDEPAGGLWRFATANGNISQIPVGSRICIIDIGGKVSSMYVAEVLPENGLHIYWSDGMALDLGIQDITSRLNDELQNLYSDQFRVRTIPENMLRDCLRNRGRIQVRGNDFDATDAFLSATAQFMDRVSSNWVDKMRGGIDIDMVVVTGGGGGLTYGSLVDELQHDHIYLADDINAINLANLRGGETAAAIWYNANRSKLPTIKEQRPVVFVFDPGNSDLKFKLLGAR